MNNLSEATNWPHFFMVFGLVIIGVIVIYTVIFILHGFINLAIDNQRKRPFRENEINAEQYSKLKEWASATPELTHWLAEELKQKTVFTGRDYENIREHLKKELEAIEAKKKQTEIEAVKAAIKQQA